MQLKLIFVFKGLTVKCHNCNSTFRLLHAVLSTQYSKTGGFIYLNLELSIPFSVKFLIFAQKMPGSHLGLDTVRGFSYFIFDPSKLMSVKQNNLNYATVASFHTPSSSLFTTSFQSTLHIVTDRSFSYKQVHRFPHHLSLGDSAVLSSK